MNKDQSLLYSKETLSYLLSKEYLDLSSYFSTIQHGRFQFQDREEILVWLFEVNELVGGSSNSIQYCTRYFDTFLSLKSISHVKVLQLVGIVSLNIALKYEHIQELSPKQMYDLCQGKFPIEAIIQTELFILNVLSWKLDVPTASEIIRHLLACTCGNFDYTSIAESADSYAALCYLHNLLSFQPPFLLAVASICCALDKFKVRDFKIEWLKVVNQEYPFDKKVLELTLEQIRYKIDDISGATENESESTEPGSPL